MDETQSSRVSDAAASRKRRSSILKSQRAPRTPLSELEFNVATPTDAGKSRRVSFSRRTGVAEFVTNEATTTWKNFYEEHNKSLESSGNESGAKGARPTISHIGKRIFDQQFEEVEAVDFGSALIQGNSRAAEFNISINNVNLTQQLAALECTVNDKKLAAPQQNFELSSLTDHQSKVFSDDLTIPVMGEMSNQINIDFSIMKPIGPGNDKCDDLDEIQKDLERSHNVVCPGPFREGEMSEYIEVDLNMTHVAVANDEVDMSITDTVHSPKVQEVSSSISLSKSRKSIVDKDWTTDKENIAVLNPYIAPREADNFAITEVPDQVLVFDGKRLTVQMEQKEIPVQVNELKCDKGNYRKTLLPAASSEKTPQRKTIVLNTNDDLPNFNSEPILLQHKDSVSVSAQELKHTMIFEKGDLSITQAVPNIIEPLNVVQLSNKRKTNVDENMTGNISLTRAVPSNVILDHNAASQKRKTIIYDDSLGNISMTQAISVNVLLDNKSAFINKRQSTVYDGENISLTEVVPANLMISDNNEKPNNKTILFQNDLENISFTQILPTNIQLHKSQNDKTTVFDRSVCNVSMTQVLPSNIILFDNEPVSNKRKTIVYEDDDADISMTQAVPANFIITDNSKVECEKKNKTVEFQNDTGEISFIRTLQTSFIQKEITNNTVFGIKSYREDDKCPVENIKVSKNDNKPTTINCSIHESKNIPYKKIKIMYDEHADISMTQDLSKNTLSTNNLIKPVQRKSIVFDNDPCNISLTRPLPTNILSEEIKRENNEKLASQSLLHHTRDTTTTKIVSNINGSAKKNMIIDNNKSNNKSFHEISNTSANPTQVTNTKATRNSEISNLSMTKPIPSKIFEIENEILKTDMENFTNLTQFGEKTLLQDTIHEQSNVDILVYQTATNDSFKSIPREYDTEVHVNKIDHNNLQDEDTKFSTGNKRMDNTIAKSVTSLTHKEETKSFVEKKSMDSTIPNSVESLSTTQDVETKTSIESKTIDKTIAKSIESLSVTGNNSDVTKEKDFGMNISIKSKENVATDLELLETIKCKLVDNTKEKPSILQELLDMSSHSVVEDFSDKKVTADLNTEMIAENSMKSFQNNSNNAIFLITKDSDEKIQSDENINKNLSTVKMLEVDKCDEIKHNLLPALECNTESGKSVQDKLIELSHSNNEEKKMSPPKNRYYEHIVSSDLQDVIKQNNKDIANVKDTRTYKSFKEADNTKELLEILSDFTDRESIVPKQGDDNFVTQVNLRKSMALEHKPEIVEPKRLSFAPKRQSIVLTREELLENLSMAQATLQQSRFELEDSEIEDTVTESPTEIHDSISSPKKSVQMSKEVVKTLHFEDESCSDASVKSDLKISPLKKTAFGETSYMTDCKTKVIPTYLKDLTENIKSLMNDLVKPMPDQMPFEVMSSPKTKKQTSTCSTQIQANLITSSQIDLDIELHSNVNSVYELNNAKSVEMDKAVVKALKGTVIDGINVDNTYPVKHFEGKSSLKKHSQNPVLVFDRHNPLNNVLFTPHTCVDVHKYNPVKSSEELSTENNSDNSNNVNEPKRVNKSEVEKVITQYNVESRIGLQSGDACSDKKGASHSLFSDPSKPLSMDRSTEGIATEVKNTEVNTLIVMKGNKELLEASSSLTLVDDAITQNAFDITMESRPIEQDSPVKVIYKFDNDEASMLENVDSDFVSNDDEPIEYSKARKRSYSPPQHDLTRPSTLSSPDVTPKPMSKMKKMSNSPIAHINKTEIRDATSEQCDKLDSNSDKTASPKKRSPRKSKSSPKYKKPGTDVTVQQLITEYKITKMEQDMIEDQIVEAIHDRMSSRRSGLEMVNIRGRSPDTLTSCASSKDQNEVQEACVKETVSYVGSQPSKVDWQPDLKELSSRNLLTECNSGVNVVAKIDMLPFMGSRECEWETSGGDTWVFRLLRARLRLRVRLAHRHHNALRTRVRADTPVEEIGVDAVPVDEKDPLAELCVRFAMDAMRYECGRGCARAGDVPLVLRRCGGVARVALRWARAMRDARTRLAYTLTADGMLTLKVANIPLRSVWEVAMRLELVVEDARETAWPRAGDVRVLGVLSDYTVTAEETARALQPLSHDWGHAPRTIWKIFRYLKHKTREDDFLRL